MYKHVLSLCLIEIQIEDFQSMNEIFQNLCGVQIFGPIEPIWNEIWRKEILPFFLIFFALFFWVYGTKERWKIGK